MVKIGVPLVLALFLSGGSAFAGSGFGQSDVSGVAAGFSRLPRLVTFFVLGAGGVIAWQMINRRDY